MNKKAQFYLIAVAIIAVVAISLVTIINSIDKQENVSLNKFEKQILDRLLKPLKDAIQEKKEKSQLDLSEDKIEMLTQLRNILETRKNKRKEIKKEVENYRKELGKSGFDFEKAMMYRELVDNEKERLEKIDISIAEVEEKILEIEGE